MREEQPPPRPADSGRRDWTIGAIVVLMCVIALAILYEPSYPVAITPRGDRYTVLDAGRAFGAQGHWTYFKFLAHDTSAVGTDSEVGMLLRGIVVAAAERNGDTVIAIQAVRRRLHLGVLFNLTTVRSYRFASRQRHWIGVPY